jgi:hypothetical protein
MHVAIAVTPLVVLVENAILPFAPGNAGRAVPGNATRTSEAAAVVVSRLHLRGAVIASGADLLRGR